MIINQELLELLQKYHVRKWEVGSSAGGHGWGGLQRYKHTNQPGRAIETQFKQTFIFCHWPTVYQQSQKNKIGGNKKLNYSTITQTHTYICKEPNKNKQH